MVGLIPIFAVEVIEPELLKEITKIQEYLDWVLKNRPNLASLVSRWNEPGRGHRHLFSLLREDRLRSLLRRMMDEEEFLSPYGIRSMSKAHEKRSVHFKMQWKNQILQWSFPSRLSTG